MLSFYSFNQLAPKRVIMKFLSLFVFGFMLPVLLPLQVLHASEADVALKRQASAAGIGLQNIADWSTQFPFLDQMKLSREWYDWGRRSDKGIIVDKNGWVSAVESGVKPSVVFLTLSKEIPLMYKHYIVRWEGKGRLKYDWCVEKAGKAKGGDRIRIRGFDSCLLTIDKTDPEDPIRNITIVPEKHIEAFDQGEIFNPDFIAKIKGFRAIRFMDWMQTNKTNQKIWDDRPEPAHRTYAKNGVPVEIMVALANKVLADPWFNMSHTADLNYMRQFAQIVKASLDVNLISYIEHSNETWNWVFPQARYSLEAAKTLFNAEGDAYLQWHGMRTAQMCDAWKVDVFKEQENRVKCVLGVQAGWPGAEQATLDCPLWVKNGNRACFKHGLDAIAITGYFSGCLSGGENKKHQKQVAGWTRLKDNGMSKAYEQVIDGRHFDCEDTLPDVKKYYDYFVKEGKKRGLSVVAYEGGQHITSNFGQTQDDKRFWGLHIGINRSPYMKKLYEKNFENWRNAGGTLFMHFVDIAAYSKYGSWGALEYVTQETSPKWEALMEFNKTPCWWENCQ